MALFSPSYCRLYKIDALYVEIHPSRNLETIPGVGKTLAPVFVANILNPERFATLEAFRGFTGMIPGKSESGLTEGKGGKMTTVGSADGQVLL